MVAKCDHLKTLKFSFALPFAFSEHGVVMLASVLKSETAIKVNVRTIGIFSKMREMLLAHKDILLKLESVEKQITNHHKKIKLIFEYPKELLDNPNPPRKLINFKRYEQ